MLGRAILVLTLLTTSGTAAAKTPSPGRARVAPRAGATKASGAGTAATRTRSPRARASRPLASELPDPATAPSYRYANLEKPACLAELAARGIAFKPVDEAPGVLAPVRIPEGVGGVRYHTALPPAERATSPYEVFDCRLVLALDDFSAILRTRGIDEVVTFSAWRPPRKGWPKDKLAERHPGGLAIDIKTLRRSGARDPDAVLEVEDDYHGKIDAPSCGPDAFVAEDPSSRTVTLRELVCEAIAARLFTSVLTPNHDHAHRNHLHLDLAPGVNWRIVR